MSGLCVFFFCFKQKTAYEMRISDWSSDVCSSDLPVLGPESVIASRAAVAALQQAKGSKYMAFHDAMMAFRGQLSDTEIFRMAGEAGLDVAKQIGRASCRERVCQYV